MHHVVKWIQAAANAIASTSAHISPFKVRGGQTKCGKMINTFTRTNVFAFVWAVWVGVMLCFRAYAHSQKKAQYTAYVYVCSFVWIFLCVCAYEFMSFFIHTQQQRTHVSKARYAHSQRSTIAQLRWVFSDPPLTSCQRTSKSDQTPHISACLYGKV